LDGQPVMAMFRRSRRSAPPLRRRQQEISRQEAELREKLDKLERMVTKGRATAQNESPAKDARQGVRGNQTEKRFHVSLAMDGEHSLDAIQRPRRPRSLRKERREGRLIFLILLTALAAAVIWLISHLHS
jgi:hypothetical protein